MLVGGVAGISGADSAPGHFGWVMLVIGALLLIAYGRQEES